MDKATIIFVCNGNIHRSVIAALCTQKLLNERGVAGDYVILSRSLQGTAETAPPQHRNLLKYPHEWSLSGPPLHEIGIEIPATQSATPITQQDVEHADLVIAMDDLVLTTRPNSLLHQFPEFSPKMHLFSELGGRIEDVPDPAGSEDAALHRSVIQTINGTLREHLDNLLHLATNI